jgi:hypothetical protein
MCCRSSPRSKSRGRHAAPIPDRLLFPAKGEDELNEPYRQGYVKDRHHDLVRNMPVEFCELVEAVEEIQHKENNAEQHDATADEAMAQIAEQTINGSVLETWAPADTINVPMIIFST